MFFDTNEPINIWEGPIASEQRKQQAPTHKNNVEGKNDDNTGGIQEVRGNNPLVKKKLLKKLY